MTQPRTERAPSDRRASIAVDLGAESCRVSLLRWQGNASSVSLVHRFANGPVEKEGSLHWPLQNILDGVAEGIRKCAEQAPEGIRSIAVDGWAVDYVRLGASGEVLDAPYCYRDERNVAAEHLALQKMSAERLYQITGVQQQSINTLYQLYADREAGLPGDKWLNLPEFLLYHLGGKLVGEYTNATHSQMVDLKSQQWSDEVFATMKLDRNAAPEIVYAGTILGTLADAELRKHIGEAALIAPACHDTASAIAGIAADDNDWAYISSGTWSLVGVVSDETHNTPSAQAANFTNLGSVGGRYCLHKGVTGMWLLKQCMDTWALSGSAWSIDSLLQAAEAAGKSSNLLDLSDPELMLMGDMPARINAQLRQRQLPTLSEASEDAPAMVSLILCSLAAAYAEILREIQHETGRTLHRIYVVGGGSRNALLNRLTAEATGLEVVAACAESSTVGNFAVQLAALESSVPRNSTAFADEVQAWAITLEGALDRPMELATAQSAQ